MQSDLLGPNAARYDAALQVKLIAVDTGEVLGTFSGRGKALDFVPEQAANKAAKQAADQVAEQILERVVRATGGARVELTIEGCPNVMACETAIRGVEALPSVAELSRLSSGRAFTKVALEPAGAPARDIAFAIEESPAVGLSVYGYSDRAIKATYDPARAIRLVLVLDDLKPVGKADGAWRGRALAGMLGTSLSNVGFLELIDGPDVTPLPDGALPRKAALARRGVPVDRAIVLTGRYTRRGPKLHVEVRLVAAASGGTLLAGQRACERAELEACAAALGEELAGKLPAAVERKRHLFRGIANMPPGFGAGGRSARPLEIEALEIGNLFPARIAYYAHAPAGEVRLHNTGTAPVERVSVRATVRGFGEGADQAVGRIEAGQTRAVPLMLSLARDALMKHEENRPAVVDVEVSYVVGDMRMREKRAQPVILHDRNALSWSTPESVAAFVTARAAPLPAYAASWLGAVPEDARGDPLGGPAAIFTGLGTLGLRYVRDPVNPFGADALDYVQFPAQTLRRGAGDGDDLAVLYAALLEATGQRALILTTPDHAFAAVEVGKPGWASLRAAVGGDRFLTYGGRGGSPSRPPTSGVPSGRRVRAGPRSCGACPPGR